MQKIVHVTLIVILVGGCTIDPLGKVKPDSAPKHVPIDVMSVQNAVPKYEKRTRAGNPGEYQVLGKRYKVLAESTGYKSRGVASWYGTKFHGRKTSNGETYDMYAMTAAHKTLPIPSYVKVTNLNNQRSVIVRINDRGPFHQNRIIDLSYTAAVQLGIKQAGTGFVEVTAIEPGRVENQQAATDSALVAAKQTNVFLQIGAFSSLVNAKQLQQRLVVGQINNSRVEQITKAGAVIYKVQIGPISQASQADELNKKLNSLGLTDTQLVVEQSQLTKPVLLY